MYRKDLGLIPYSKRVFDEQVIKPIYSKGTSKLINVNVDRECFIIYAWFVRNFKGRIKGYISVYNYRGELLYKANYRDGVLVKGKGNTLYAWLVRLFVQVSKIPIKTIKLGDEK